MVQELSSKQAYHGAIFDVYEKVFRLNDHTPPFGRQIIQTSDSITLALLNDQNQVLIEREYRSAINQMSWALPAGRINYQEAPDVTARRELAEETGYLVDPKQIHRLDKVSLSNGIISEFSHIYYARLVDGQYQKIAKHFDNDEAILDYQWVTLDKALRKTDGAASHLAIQSVKLQLMEKLLNQEEPNND